MRDVDRMVMMSAMDWITDVAISVYWMNIWVVVTKATWR